VGDGPTSVIQSSYIALYLGTSGAVHSDLVVKGLKILGQPGKYMVDGNIWPAIQLDSVKGAIISDCEFQGTGWAVNNVGETYGTKIENCRVNGWGQTGIFCNGGEQILNCRLVQDDPVLEKNSSHGLYIHSGAKDVLVQDVRIENARNYGCQIWGQDVGTTTERITFRRVTFKGCKNGLTIQQGEVTAARAKNVLVEDCSFLNTYDGAALGVKQGDGIIVRNNVIDGARTGMEIGVWAPYSPNFWVSDLSVSHNTIRNCQLGIWR